MTETWDPHIFFIFFFFSHLFFLSPALHLLFFLILFLVYPAILFFLCCHGSFVGYWSQELHLHFCFLPPLSTVDKPKTVKYEFKTNTHVPKLGLVRSHVLLPLVTLNSLNVYSFEVYFYFFHLLFDCFVDTFCLFSVFIFNLYVFNDNYKNTTLFYEFPIFQTSIKEMVTIFSISDLSLSAYIFYNLHQF